MAYTKTYKGPDFVQTPGAGSVMRWTPPEDVAFHYIQVVAVPPGGLELTQMNTIGHLWWKAGDKDFDGQVQKPIPVRAGEKVHELAFAGAVIRTNNYLEVHFTARRKGRFAFDIVAAPLDQETWYTRAKKEKEKGRTNA